MILWLKLAVIGIVPDMDLPREKLKKLVQMAYAFLPGGQIGDGNPNSYPEIFGAMLRAHGYMRDDVPEALNLLWGTGKALHYLEIPDFDRNAENREERKEADLIGDNFKRIFDAVAKSRDLSHAEKKENKAIAEWKSTM